MLSNSPKRGPAVAWETLFETTIKEGATFHSTPEHSLDLGLDPQLLLRYAAGNTDHGERGAATQMVVDLPWAMSAVVGLVKAARNPQSLASRLLKAARNGGLVHLEGGTLSLKTATDEEICRLIEEAIAV